MATNFRFNSISPESQSSINSIISGLNSDEKKKYLDSVEQNGKLPDYIPGYHQQIGQNKIDQINKELGSYNQSEDFNKLTDPKANEAGMTQEELQARLDALQGKQGEVTRGILNPVVLRQKVAERMGRSQESLQFADNLAEFIKSTGNLPPPYSIQGQFRSDYERLYNVFQQEFNSGLYHTQNVVNNTDDINRVKYQIDTMKAQGATEQQINDYLDSLPADLQKSRDEFLSGEQSNAIAQFQDYIPLAKQSLNARGLLDSGQVEDTLSTKALNIESALEAQRADLEAQDNQFYFNAAYRNTVRQALLKSQNLASDVEATRQGVLSDRTNRFKSSQAELDKTIDDQLFKDDAERKLRLHQSQLQTQKEAADEAQKMALVTTGVQAGATIIGSKIGSSSGRSGNTNSTPTSGIGGQ